MLIAKKQGADWQPTPWGAQALISWGNDPALRLTPAQARDVWNGKETSGPDGLVSVDDGQPLGWQRRGRLLLPSTARTELLY